MAIKLVITDVDGTLTDGTVEYRSDGTTARRFSVIDGAGMMNLKNNGVQVVWMTGSIGDDIRVRADFLNIPLYEGAPNKGEMIVQFFSEKYRFSEIAFFGDDSNDLEAMSLCQGIVGCPQSAQPDVRSYCKNRTNGIVVNGTAGIDAFRMFSRIILYANGFDS